MNWLESLDQNLDRLQGIERVAVISEYGSYIEHIQRRRAGYMAKYYDDLICNPRYSSAVNFLLNDLYASPDLIKRMLDLRQARAAMSRALPDAMMATVARAVEFSVCLFETDLAVAEAVSEDGGDVALMSESEFDTVLLKATSREQLERQLELVVIVGREIEAVVHKPFVSTALKLCRKPAKLMGLSELQAFLERGFSAFKSMRGSETFFQIFKTREQDRINKLFIVRQD